MITFAIKRGEKKALGKIVNKDKAMRQDDLDLFINRALRKT